MDEPSFCARLLTFERTSRRTTRDTAPERERAPPPAASLPGTPGRAALLSPAGTPPCAGGSSRGPAG
eukprot:scaffold33323_cov68-Phaeocystis_antarctica.AAC.2